MGIFLQIVFLGLVLLFVLSSFACQNKEILMPGDATQKLAPLIASVLAEIQQTPGQPLLNYLDTPAYKAQLASWQENENHG